MASGEKQAPVFMVYQDLKSIIVQGKEYSEDKKIIIIIIIIKS